MSTSHITNVEFSLVNVPAKHKTLFDQYTLELKPNKISKKPSTTGSPVAPVDAHLGSIRTTLQRMEEAELSTILTHNRSLLLKSRRKSFSKKTGFSGLIISFFLSNLPQVKSFLHEHLSQIKYVTNTLGWLNVVDWFVLLFVSMYIFFDLRQSEQVRLEDFGMLLREALSFHLSQAKAKRIKEGERQSVLRSQVATQYQDRS